MNKSILLFFLLAVVVGCSSNSTNKKRVELDELTDEDFKSPKQVLYNRKDDKFKAVTEEGRSVLNAETLARLDDPSDLEAKGIVDEITIACYEKDFEKAFALIKSKSSSYKRNPIFWNQVGTCFMLKGERRKALLFYNKALEFKSSYSPAYNNLGFMYKLDGEDQKALVAFTRSKKSNRYARTPLFNLGNLYLEYGLYNQAISTLTGLHNLDKKDTDVINGLAVAYLMKGNYSESKKFYKKLDPDLFEKPNFGINYAYLLYRQNKIHESRELLKNVDMEKESEWKNYYMKLSTLVGVKR